VSAAGVTFADLTVFGGVEAMLAQQVKLGEDVFFEVELEEAREEVGVLLDEVKDKGVFGGDLQVSVVADFMSGEHVFGQESGRKL
jgi:hypothetical protein